MGRAVVPLSSTSTNTSRVPASSLGGIFTSRGRRRPSGPGDGALEDMRPDEMANHERALQDGQSLPVGRISDWS